MIIIIIKSVLPKLTLKITGCFNAIQRVVRRNNPDFFCHSMSLLLINSSLYKCYNYLIYINVLCASSVHPKGVYGIACIMYIPLSPHVPYGIGCIMYIQLSPHVPCGIACTMCRGGIVFHDFGAAHDVCLDPLVRSPGYLVQIQDWASHFTKDTLLLILPKSEPGQLQKN
jgi:hypothetical protein